MLQMRGFKVHCFNLYIAPMGQKKKGWTGQEGPAVYLRAGIVFSSVNTALLKQVPVTG